MFVLVFFVEVYYDGSVNNEGEDKYVKSGVVVRDVFGFVFVFVQEWSWDISGVINGNEDIIGESVFIVMRLVDCDLSYVGVRVDLEISGDEEIFNEMVGDVEMFEQKIVVNYYGDIVC